LDGAARIIDAGQDTVIFVGDGARNAAADISTLARKLHAPIVHTYRALDLYPFEDPQVIGGLGLIGSKAAYDAVHRCDVMLMVGSDYPYSEFLPRKAAVIQVDERAEAIGRRLPVSQAVVGSSRPSIAGLTPRVKARTSDRWLRAAQHDCASWRHMLDEKADPERSKQRIHPQALARTVSDLAATAVFPTRPWRSGLKSGNQRRSRARSSALTSANASSTRF
jgi:thiamine pyrophosphate-dependent acetolactate synthase large subunit-like protein